LNYNLLLPGWSSLLLESYSPQRQGLNSRPELGSRPWEKKGARSQPCSLPGLRGAEEAGSLVKGGRKLEETLANF